MKDKFRQFETFVEMEKNISQPNDNVKNVVELQQYLITRDLN